MVEALEAWNSLITISWENEKTEPASVRIRAGINEFFMIVLSLLSLKLLRQPDNKSAAPPLPGPEIDVPTMHINDFPDNTQPDACPFWFCGEKGDKYLGLNFRGDTGSIVSDLEDDFVLVMSLSTEYNQSIRLVSNRKQARFRLVLFIK